MKLSLFGCCSAQAEEPGPRLPPSDVSDGGSASGNADTDEAAAWEVVDLAPASAPRAEEHQAFIDGLSDEDHVLVQALSLAQQRSFASLKTVDERVLYTQILAVRARVNAYVEKPKQLEASNVTPRKN